MYCSIVVNFALLFEVFKLTLHEQRTPESIEKLFFKVFYFYKIIFIYIISLIIIIIFNKITFLKVLLVNKIIIYLMKNLTSYLPNFINGDFQNLIFSLFQCFYLYLCIIFSVRYFFYK